jgi:hypothetical protein
VFNTHSLIDRLAIISTVSTEFTGVRCDSKARYGLSLRLFAQIFAKQVQEHSRHQPRSGFTFLHTPAKAITANNDLAGAGIARRILGHLEISRARAIAATSTTGGDFNCDLLTLHGHIHSIAGRSNHGMRGSRHGSVHSIGAVK